MRVQVCAGRGGARGRGQACAWRVPAGHRLHMRGPVREGPGDAASRRSPVTAAPPGEAECHLLVLRGDAQGPAVRGAGARGPRSFGAEGAGGGRQQATTGTTRRLSLRGAHGAGGGGHEVHRRVGVYEAPAETAVASRSRPPW